MEDLRPLMAAVRSKSKQSSLLWLEGLREALCLHRVVIYCLRSSDLAIRTGQCFLLNGFIFLGSIFILRSMIIPTLLWILPDQCPDIHYQEICSFGFTLRFYSFLRFGLVQLFYVFWFYPLYIFSFILSTLCIIIMTIFWNSDNAVSEILGIARTKYNDIAKYGFFAIAKDVHTGAEKSNSADKPSDLEGIMIGIAEQFYSVLLLSFFFLQVYVTGFIPYVGKAISFLLLSWMYAYYCFEYKWNHSGLSLDKRLDFFESNWAFFGGFGCPCIVAIFLFSPLVSYGVMAILYPLFVLTATGSEADKIIALPRRKWKGFGLGRLPIFVVADYLSLRVLSLFPVRSHQKSQE